MAITHYANELRASTRPEVLDFLEQQKRRHPGFRVIDVGGGADVWADRYTDAYVDVNRFDTNKRLFCGDICEPGVWNEIEQACGQYDFSICTHVLEDVRDPLFVARGLMQISKAGFVSMPSKHTEFMNIESRMFLGYCHHRWIYTVRDDSANEDATFSPAPQLHAIAKFPIVQGWNRGFHSPLAKLVDWFSGNQQTRDWLIRHKLVPTTRRPAWIRPDRGTKEHELCFFWERDFDFRFLNGDYAGHSLAELSRLFTEELAAGV